MTGVTITISSFTRQPTEPKGGRGAAVRGGGPRLRPVRSAAGRPLRGAEAAFGADARYRARQPGDTVCREPQSIRVLLLRIHTHYTHMLRVCNTCLTCTYVRTLECPPRDQHAPQTRRRVLCQAASHGVEVSFDIYIYIYMCMYVCIYIYMYTCPCPPPARGPGSALSAPATRVLRPTGSSNNSNNTNDNNDNDDDNNSNVIVMIIVVIINNSSNNSNDSNNSNSSSTG